MTAATARLRCVFRHLCAASLFPVGNYPFPVVIIILPHAADLSGNTSHFHLQPAGCFPAVPSLHPPPRRLVLRSKGQTCLNEDGGRMIGRNDRKEMRKGKTGRVGWAQQRKMDALSISTHPHSHLHTCTHILSPQPVLSKEKKSAKTDLPSVNDRYLSYSGAVCTDSLEKRSGGRREGASSLSRPIRVVD